MCGLKWYFKQKSPRVFSLRYFTGLGPMFHCRFPRGAHRIGASTHNILRRQLAPSRDNSEVQIFPRTVTLFMLQGAGICPLPLTCDQFDLFTSWTYPSLQETNLWTPGTLGTAGYQQCIGHWWVPPSTNGPWALPGTRHHQPPTGTGHWLLAGTRHHWARYQQHWTVSISGHQILVATSRHWSTTGTSGHL